MRQAKTNAKEIRPSALQVALAKLEEGVLEHFPEGLRLTLGRETLDRRAICAQLWRWIEICWAVDRAEQAFTEALAERLAIRVDACEFQLALTTLLKRHFGPDSRKLECFGIHPDEPAAPSREQKALAAPRRSLTRERRSRARKARLVVAGGWTAAPPAEAPKGAPGPAILAWSDDDPEGSSGSSPAGAPAAAPAPGDAEEDEPPGTTVPWVG